MLSRYLRRIDPCVVRYMKICSITHPKESLLLKTVYLPGCSIVKANGFHFNSHQLQNKPQYEYDASTDTFRPKHQTSFTYTPPSKSDNRPPFVNFLRRWTMTLFMITGGIAWGGLLFVSLFVDVKETPEFPFHTHDLDDEVRMLVFYNLAHGKDDLARIISMHSDKNIKNEDKFEDLHNSMHSKQEILMKTIEEAKSNEKIIKILGNPVQMCGYRVAGRIGKLIQDFQELAADSLEGNKDFPLNNDDNEIVENTWTAECLLEGSNGIASLTLSFKRKDKNSEWVVDNFSIQKMEKSGNVFDNRDVYLF